MKDLEKIKIELKAIFDLEPEYEFIDVVFGDNGKTKAHQVQFKHKVCGNISQMNINGFVRGTRCQYSDADKKIEIQIILKNEPEYELIGEFEKDDSFNTIINIKHSVCGQVSKVRFNKFKQGSRCKNKECWVGKSIKTKKKTCEEKYGIGIDSEFKHPETMKKIKESMKNKFGVEYHLQSDKVKEENKKKYYEEVILKFENYIPLFTLDEYYKNKDDNGQFIYYKWKCKKCETEFEDDVANGHIPSCSKCFPKYISNVEKEICLFIESLGINTEHGKLEKTEIDIMTDEGIYIEVDGVHWHTEGKGKHKNYHKNKTELCNKYNKQLIHIFDLEWTYKQDIVKSILRSKFKKTNKIFARKCSIREVNSQKAAEFQTKTHIQGDKTGINIGLFYNNKLVSLCSFGKSRYNKDYEYELLRYSNELNISVVGGFSRILKYFTNKYSTSLITYADVRFSNGNLYKMCGFKLLRQSEPNYFYIKNNGMLESREKYQKHKLKNKLEKFDENLTEWENMQLNGYDRIWDCGNLVYIYKGDKK